MNWVNDIDFFAKMLFSFNKRKPVFFYLNDSQFLAQNAFNIAMSVAFQYLADKTSFYKHGLLNIVFFATRQFLLLFFFYNNT